MNETPSETAEEKALSTREELMERVPLAARVIDLRGRWDPDLDRVMIVGAARPPEEIDMDAGLVPVDEEGYVVLTRADGSEERIER